MCGNRSTPGKVFRLHLSPGRQNAGLVSLNRGHLCIDRYAIYLLAEEGHFLDGARQGKKSRGTGFPDARRLKAQI